MQPGTDDAQAAPDIDGSDLVGAPIKVMMKEREVKVERVERRIAADSVRVSTIMLPLAGRREGLGAWDDGGRSMSQTNWRGVGISDTLVLRLMRRVNVFIDGIMMELSRCL